MLVFNIDLVTAEFEKLLDQGIDPVNAMDMLKQDIMDEDEAVASLIKAFIQFWACRDCIDEVVREFELILASYQGTEEDVENFRKYWLRQLPTNSWLHSKQMLQKGLTFDVDRFDPKTKC